MRLHHVGIIVDDIEKRAAAYRRIIPVGFPSEIVYDEVQRVRVAFADAGGGVAIEFIEPESEDSPIARALRKGTQLHHLCYEVRDLEQALAQAREAGALIVCEPVPARAFQGRRIAFIYLAVGGLTEFVESL